MKDYKTMFEALKAGIEGGMKSIDEMTEGKELTDYENGMRDSYEIIINMVKWLEDALL